MRSFILYVIIITAALACKEPNAGQQESQTPVYPVLPAELHQQLFDQVDYLDFIFHNYPFSMSQSEKPSIQTNISYIGREPVYEIPQTCKPIARQFYQIRGEIILESDVYYSEGCYFYVFIKDNQPLYACKMTENGIGFFGDILQKAMKAANQARG